MRVVRSWRGFGYNDRSDRSDWSDRQSNHERRRNIFLRHVPSLYLTRVEAKGFKTAHIKLDVHEWMAGRRRLN